MQLFIRDLAVEDLDAFINQDSDRYGSTDFHDESETVTISIKVKCVTIAEECIVIIYPNNNTAIISVPSDHYFKAEVL